MSLARLFSLREASPPDAAVALTSRGVSGAVFEWRGGRPALRAHAVEALPPDTLIPSLTAPNFRDRAAVEAALRLVLDRIGRPARVGLIIPDIVAKVSLVRFEQVPERARDLDQLVRWQVRKAAPFPIEEAQVACVRAGRYPDGHL